MPEFLSRLERRTEQVFWDYLYGDWDSLTRWAWLYINGAVLVATALFGVALATDQYVAAFLLAPFPLCYFYRRYAYARPENG